MKSSSVASMSRALRIWSKYATWILAPWRTVPHALSPGLGVGALVGAGSGASSPSISLSSVVLPAPLGPSRPTLSPRKIVAEKSRTMVLSGPAPEREAKVLLTWVNSATSFPLAAPLATSSLTLPTASRRASRRARIFSKRVMRPWARVRRASTPLRIHTSSCAKSLSARALMTASCAICSSFCSK